MNLLRHTWNQRLSLTAGAALLVGVGTLTPTAAGAAGTGSSMLANSDFGNVAQGRTDVPRCAPITDRQFSGTITGADGLYPNVTIGFDVKDRQGHNIDIATGCPTHGYGAIVQLNHFILGQGAPAGTEMFNTPTKYSPLMSQGFVTNQWSLLGLPANASVIWIETYSRAYTGSPCGQPCAGNMDTSKYGLFNRRAVPVTASPVALTLPVTPQFGGNAGTIRVTVRNRAGHPVSLKKIYAWSSLKKDGSQTMQGWGMGVSLGNGVWEVPALAPGQPYVMWLYSPSGAVVARKGNVKVSAAHTTKVNVKI